MKGINFSVCDEERQIIHDIAARAVSDIGEHIDRGHGHLGVQMDVTCVHANGNPLRLRELLNADAFNFSHDVLGIYSCLNRQTGKLERGFRPRFSL